MRDSECMVKGNDYRDDIERLIEEQNLKETMAKAMDEAMEEEHEGSKNLPLPPCPFDKKPCSNPGKGCETSFGSADGEEETIKKCPRFPH